MATKAPRYGFIDLLRGIALVFMIETHVVLAYLPETSRHNAFFFWLSYVNGLVAPAFLFASGFSIILSGGRKWEDWLRFRLPFWHQMRRLGFIALIGYFLHAPALKLSSYLNASSSFWLEALQVDILHCIVASLLLIHLLIFVLRKRGAFALCSGTLALAVSFLTPWMWSFDFAGRIPLALALFLNPHHTSLFPLFPWLSFVLWGSCLSHYFLKAADRKHDHDLMKLAFIAGVALILCGLLLKQVSYNLPGVVDFYTTSPLYVIIRLGWVMIVCSLLYAAEKKLDWHPKLLTVAGQESLLVYGAHLLLIFAVLRGKRFGPILGTEAGYLWCATVSVLIIALMLWLAWQWHRMKAFHPDFAKFVQAASVAIAIVVFLMR
jgi:uncharacterized membrane protein